jgi:hypothetical protein
VEKRNENFLELFLDSIENRDLDSARKLVIRTLMHPKGARERMSLLLSPTAKVFGKDGVLEGINSYMTGKKSLPLAPFQRDYYLTANPDVAAVGVDPLIHFLTLGIHEGRTPHPLIDTKELKAKNPDLSHDQCLIQYCYGSKTYLDGAQPQVDVVGYISTLRKVPKFNPIFQIYSEMPDSLKWLNRRLLAIESASSNPNEALAASFTNIFLSNLKLGEREPRVLLAPKKLILEDISIEECSFICPGLFIVAKDSYSELSESPISSVASSLWIEASEKLVYVSPDQDILYNQVFVLRSAIGVSFLKRYASEGLTTALAPLTKISEMALRRFINENQIPGIKILEVGKIYPLAPTAKVEIVETNPPPLIFSLTDDISRFNSNLDPLRLIDISNWHSEKSKIPDGWNSPSNFMVVDFEKPNHWLSSTLHRKQVVVDQGYLEPAYLLYSNVLAGDV